MPEVTMQSVMGAAALPILFVAVVLTVAPTVFMLVAMWQVYAKAGLPGWGSLVPFYNLFLFVKLAGKPGWWFVLMLVPVVNLVVGIILAFGVAKCFGKSGGFAVGLILLGFIFFPILAFGSAEFAPPIQEAVEEDWDEDEDDEVIQEAVAIAELDDDSE